MDEVILRCPDCRGVLAAHPIAGVRLHVCPECGGLWADAEALGRIHRERAAQAAVLRLAPPRTPRAAAAGPRLCPRCAAAMAVVEYAPGAHLHVDACGGHGTWFDREELPQAVALVRERGRRPPAAPPRRVSAQGGSGPAPGSASPAEPAHVVVEVGGAVLKGLAELALAALFD